MQPEISVIICTHNPRPYYLERVLKALQQQTLSQSIWEILLIDNASNRLLADEIDLSWHCHSRHIREREIGLIHARRRGILESKAEILVFVDDDNVLESDYLEVTLKLGKDYPFIGAWGGQLKPEFEIQPPKWIEPFLKHSGIRKFDEDKWSNLLHQHETTPCGAGMCVRKIVANKYVELIENDPNRQILGRKSSHDKTRIMFSCEDTDLAFTACDLGLGTGQFKDLKLTHLIPAYRLTEDYLIKLFEGINYSHEILDSFRDQIPTKVKNYNQKNTIAIEKTYIFLKELIYFSMLLLVNQRKFRFEKAVFRGKALARRELSKKYSIEINKFSQDVKSTTIQEKV